MSAVLNHFLKPTVLVTGGTGSVGRAVCRELVQHGYLVLGLVRTEEARARLPYAVIPVIGDVRRPDAWEYAVEQAEIVVNLALPSIHAGGPRERAEAEAQGRVIADVLDGIATLCRRHKKLLVHSFSSLLFDPDPDGWVRESSALASGRGYGARQRIVRPVFERHRKKGLRGIGVAPTFVYGRGGWFEHDFLGPMSRGEFRMIGDGSQTMHYVEASDCASGFRLAIEHGLEGDDYLLADDRPTTLGAFAKLVARELGAPDPVEVPEEDAVAAAGAWAVEAHTWCPKVDSSRARERLGWKPRYRTIEEGIPIAVRAYKRAQLESVHV